MSTLPVELQVSAVGPDAVLESAVRLHQSGDCEQAERLYRSILLDHPRHAHTHHNLGILTMQRRQPTEALTWLKAAVDISPAPRYWLSYVDGLLQARQILEARKVVQDAVRHGLRGGSINALTERLEKLAAGIGSAPDLWMPDLPGDAYTRVLERLHSALTPATYLEIGVETGATLALARCSSIGIDPRFQFGDLQLLQKMTAKAILLLYQMPSDHFFARFDPSVLLDAPVDLAFLDGMHRCEYLLRDFFHIERFCRPNAVIALHDCLPLELPMAERTPNAVALDPPRQGMWTGDVWRTALLLKRRRPDLHMLVLDAPPSGLVLITHLDPDNRLLSDNQESLIAEMLSWSLDTMTLPSYYAEMEVQPEIHFRRSEEILAWARQER